MQQQRSVGRDGAVQQLGLRLAGGLAVAGKRAQADRGLAPHAAAGVDAERDAAVDGEPLDERRERVGDEVGRRDPAQGSLAQRDDEGLARDALVALALGELVIGEVADEAGVQRCRPAARHSRDRELDRELRPVGALRLELDALLEQPSAAAAEQAAQPAAMCLALGRGDDQLGHVGTDDVVAHVAEHPLRGGVELEHDAVRIDRDDRVQRHAQDGLVDARSR